MGVRQKDVPNAPDDRRVIERARCWSNPRSGGDVRRDDDRRDTTPVDVVIETFRRRISRVFSRGDCG